MHYLFAILLITYAHAETQDVAEAKASIRALMAPLIPGAAQRRPKGAEKFRVDGCEKHKVNWTDVLMMRKEVVLDYKFKEGCDIQGAIRPKVLESFPAELALRNLQNYNKINSENTVRMELEAKPILKLELRSGVLTGAKGQVKFEADYSVRMNPLSPKQPVDENKGGEIRISEVFGKKVNLREKIFVK